MKKAAPFFILAAGILWGCLGIFVRVLNSDGLYAMDIVHLRAVVTSLGLGIFLVIYDRKLLKIKIKDIWCFLGTGLLSIVFFNFCYFQAISVTSMSIASVLLYTAPAIVMILSFFLFREKFTARKIIALILTFIGCLLVTGIISTSGNDAGTGVGIENVIENATGSITGSGILFGLGAGFGYALYSIFSRYALNRGYTSLTITFYTFLIAGIGTFFLVDFKEIYPALTADVSTLLWCLGLGILGTVIPYLTYTTGLKYTENGKASIIASIEPVTATIIGFLLYQETLGGTEAVGVLLVIIALIFL